MYFALIYIPFSIMSAHHTTVDLGLVRDGKCMTLSYDGSLGDIDALIDINVNGTTHGLYLALKKNKLLKIRFRQPPKQFHIQKVAWWCKTKTLPRKTKTLPLPKLFKSKYKSHK